MRNTGMFEDKTEIVSNYIAADFKALADKLRMLQGATPEMFMPVAKMTGIGPHRACALSRISGMVRHLGVPEKRLRTIGWTKLQMIGRHVSEDNAEHLLRLAGRHTVGSLEARLKEELTAEDARVLQFYLSPPEYGRARAQLIANGAVVSGKGLLKKEAALMALIDKH